MKKKILIINTGGTISSVKTDNGYQPQAGAVKKALQTLPEFQHPAMPKFEVLSYQPLIDSSDITVQDWNKLANDINTYYDDYDGFVILHGTDTMAYTSSALSFMLEDLSKPVIITGSQIPLSEFRTDAKDNLITALQFACDDSFNEVAIYFENCLLRGNRAQKVSSQQFCAFDSPNYPHLAHAGITLNWDNYQPRPRTQGAFQAHSIKPHFIANFRLFPGFSTRVLNHLLEQPLKGLILETYGSGNAQSDDTTFHQALKQASERGIIIVNCTQCHQGHVNMDTYATGIKLKQAGLISGHDMTPEAAHCKLLYLLSRFDDISQIKSAMERDLRGELAIK